MSASTLRSPKEIVYLEYEDPTHLEPPPSEEWTRFVCISDTHSHDFDVPAGDVLLHSGDLTNTGTVADFEKTMNWLYSLPHKLKIIIAGNHDLTLHEGWYESNWERWHSSKGYQKREPIIDMLKGQKAKAAGIIYLEDEEFEFQTKSGGKTWSVYGSPWSPEFWNWAFNYEEHEAEALVGKYPKTDILLTHGPPWHVLDLTTGQDFAGCKTLAARLPSLRPRLHLFGHIHEAHGAHIHAWTGTNESPRVQNSSPPAEYADAADADRTVFVNAANWPAGPRRKEFSTAGFGGPGFRPVVVDLLE